KGGDGGRDFHDGFLHSIGINETGHTGLSGWCDMSCLGRMNSALLRLLDKWSQCEYSFSLMRIIKQECATLWAFMAEVALYGNTAMTPSLNDIELFVEVARSSGFTRASEALNMPASTISRRITQL